MGKLLSPCAVVLCAVLFCLGATSRAQAVYNGPRSERVKPAFLLDLGRGLAAGSLVGLSAGYLVVRQDGLYREDLGSLAYWMGAGAMIGTGVGFITGVTDLSDHRAGRGSVMLRDTLYGAAVGSIAGAGGGTIAFAQTHDGEHVLLGSALGTLSGAGLGLLIGMFEKPTSVNPLIDRPRRTWQARVTPTRDAGGRMVWLGGAGGRF